MVSRDFLWRAILATALVCSPLASAAVANPEHGATEESPPKEKTEQDRSEPGASSESTSEGAISARDVAQAPQPHQARGLSTEDPSRKEGRGQWVARALLTVPRWSFELAMQPARASLWAYDRYQLGERFKRVFFNESETIGLFPSFFFETGFGFNAGLRFVHRDLLGKKESIHARAGWGGQYQQRYSLRANSGDRIRAFQIEASGEMEVRDREHFSGIGNRDLGSSADLMLPLDPLGEGPVVDSRYRQRFGRVWLAAKVPLLGPLSFRASAGLIDRKFSDQHVDARGDLVVSRAYELAAIPGFSQGPRLAYGELELSYSSRRPASAYVPLVWSSTGWMLRSFAGPARGLGGDATRFLRYGADLQRYINLFDSSRVLVLRAYGEGLSKEAGERVPFSELPTLGGNRLLRGYPDSRFRDRYVEELSVEYQFDINAGSYGYLFVDTGKAMRTIDADAIEDLRYGFGGGVQINTQRSFLARVLIAGSKDGDFLLSLSFEPQFDLRERFDRL